MRRELNRLMENRRPFFRFIKLRKKRTDTACFSPAQEQPGKTGTSRWHPVENPLPLLRDPPDHSATPSGGSSSISFLLCIVTTTAWNFSPLSGRKYVSLAADKKLPSSWKETWYHAGLTGKRGRGARGSGLGRGRRERKEGWERENVAYGSLQQRPQTCNRLRDAFVYLSFFLS